MQSTEEIFWHQRGQLWNRSVQVRHTLNFEQILTRASPERLLCVSNLQLGMLECVRWALDRNVRCHGLQSGFVIASIGFVIAVMGIASIGYSQYWFCYSQYSLSSCDQHHLISKQLYKTRKRASFDAESSRMHKQCCHARALFFSAYSQVPRLVTTIGSAFTPKTSSFTHKSMRFSRCTMYAGSLLHNVCEESHISRC
jgi:hypothetical protein